LKAIDCSMTITFSKTQSIALIHQIKSPKNRRFPFLKNRSWIWKEFDSLYAGLEKTSFLCFLRPRHSIINSFPDSGLNLKHKAPSSNHLSLSANELELSAVSGHGVYCSKSGALPILPIHFWLKIPGKTGFYELEKNIDRKRLGRMERNTRKKGIDPSAYRTM